MPRTKSQSQKTTPRTAIYLRVSTEEQASDGYGIEVQRDRAKAQIAAKGWTFTGEYVDAGISGTKEASSRPGLAALLEAVEARQIDAVVVLALDRLGRNTRLVLTLVETLTAAHVALVSCKESLDTSTPQGQFVLTMFAALAQLERDVIVERTTAGRNERGKQDGERGGRVPYGYTRQADSSIAVDEAAARVVRRIFALKEAGVPMATIADMLNAEGLTTARKGQMRYSGARWYASTVQSVLRNESAYKGGRRGASEVNWIVIL